MYQETLALIARNRSVPEIAAELDTREDAVRGMIQSMVRAGHLQEIGCETTGCSACPMSEACGMDNDHAISYLLTADGQAVLETAEGPPDLDLTA